MPSKITLLDVNVLVALFDDKHQYSLLTNQWLTAFVSQGNRWATCPITQNGCLRILSTPTYPNHFPIHDIKQKLQKATSHSSHIFWEDNISLLDDDLINWTNIQGNKQLTDIYLMALSHHHQSSFTTLDKRMQTTSIKDSQNNLLIHLL